MVALLSEDGQIVRSDKFPTIDLFEDFITNLISKLKAEFISDEVKGIGVGAPGEIDYDSGDGLIFGNLPWHNVPIARDLNQAFNLPVVVENDANAAAVAEANRLDVPAHIVVYVTISTGIGTGIVIDGKLADNFRRSEGGSMLLEYEGKPAQWEDFASGKAIYERYGTYARDLDDDNAWKDIAFNIALGLSNIAALFQPDTIILGGSIGQYFSKYQAHLHDAMTELKDKMYDLPAIVQAKHPEDAVAYGCYHLLKESLKDLERNG